MSEASESDFDVETLVGKDKDNVFCFSSKTGEDNVSQHPKLYSLFTFMPYIGYKRRNECVNSTSRFKVVPHNGIILLS